MKLCPKCQKQFSDDANFCPVDAARLAPLEGQAAATEDSISARFELGPQLGGHRTGAVHRATDRTTGQPAALKIIAPEVLSLPGVAPRLERELKQLERVQSAGVAKVLASGKRGDDSWVAIELLDGAQTLAAAIAARGPIGAEQASHLIEVVGEALIEAAQVGVVHRDLAPKNVLFAGADVKLINFSLPVPPGERADKGAGVAEFVAPEQHDGKPVDQRSNLYSLGALYYFVLTGSPVQLDDAGAVRPPSAVVHDPAQVPAGVEAIILRALDRSPTKRFLTVRQFVDEVSRVARAEADPRAAQPQGRAKPKAELVQTLLGFRSGAVASPIAGAPSAGAANAAMAVQVSAMPSGPTTVAGIIAQGGADDLAQTLPERSPWAAPAEADAATVLDADPIATQIGIAPISASAAAASLAPAPVAPVVPAPLLAAPMLANVGAVGATGAAKPDDKGRFRETLWFKKGELDAEAAEAAAQERARTGRDPGQDKADQLPIDERYKDDGSVSRSDKEKYSLRTGGTQGLPAVRPARAATSAGKVTDDALISEMKGGRTRVLAVIVAAVIAILVIVLILR
jgi:serine/threonine-protein kinase